MKPGDGVTSEEVVSEGDEGEKEEMVGHSPREPMTVGGQAGRVTTADVTIQVGESGAANIVGARDIAEAAGAEMDTAHAAGEVKDEEAAKLSSYLMAEGMAVANVMAAETCLRRLAVSFLATRWSPERFGVIEDLERGNTHDSLAEVRTI